MTEARDLPEHGTTVEGGGSARSPPVRPAAPSGDAGSRAADDIGLRGLMRVFMANRGVWESGWWLGPTV